MIELSAELSGNEIARQFEVSKQRVHQILNRWKHLRPARPEPLIRPKVERVSKKRREIRSQIVSFRLTAKQTDKIREALMTWGFGNRLSSSAACRGVLLAAVGWGRVDLVGTGISVDPLLNNGQQQRAPAPTTDANLSQ